MKSTIGTLAATVLLNAFGASATTSAYCPETNVCYRWGVPEAAASSGSGDVYFQIKAPTTFQWVAVGIGSRMSGSQIFVIYQDGSGNVTLSPRSASGHNEPQYSADSGLELIDGSGVSNSEMTANIRCSDCSSLDLTGSNSWIAAWKKGDSLDSSSTSATITEHDGHDSFSVDFSTATFSTTGNPFTSDSSSNNGSDTNSGSNSGSDNTSGSNDGVVSQKNNNSNTLAYAHGIVMAIVFVIAYPVGAVAMPLVGNWLLHAGWQFLAFLGMWAGFGIGYVVAHDDGIWWKNTHTKMGTIVCALLGLQPILGWAHHQYFRKHQQRGLISHGHIWYGRILMVIGIVNGGLGLQLANAPRAFTIAYSVVAGIVSILYVAGSLVGGMRKRSRSKQLISPQMTHEDHPATFRPRPRYR